MFPFAENSLVMPVFVPAVPLAPPAPSVCHSVRDGKGYGQLAYISLALIQGEVAKISLPQVIAIHIFQTIISLLLGICLVCQCDTRSEEQIGFYRHYFFSSLHFGSVTVSCSHACHACVCLMCLSNVPSALVVWLKESALVQLSGSSTLPAAVTQFVPLNLLLLSVESLNTSLK